MTYQGKVREIAATRAARATESGLRELDAGEVVIGKDILELLSSAMYVDPMSVYREYVQNAADAVDDARRLGQLVAGEAGRVEVNLEPSTRSVWIRDNGTGIAWPDFVRRMSALGASAKRGSPARGFRGVGRLGGLGYAQELIFRSRTPGEAQVSEIRWDCRKLRALLRSLESDDLTGLLTKVVTAGRVDASDRPERFFEVELRGIVRLRADRLMDPTAVSDYLAQVAPVPFAPEFRFGSAIAAALDGAVAVGHLHLSVSGLDTPVYRPHRNTFAIDERNESTFSNIEFVEFPGIDGGIAGIGWVLHHDYEGAIPQVAQVKGLRLRCGNMQVGDNMLLEELFPESRFNAWSVGEIHVVDNRILPNGRRDHFEQNAHFQNLLNHITPTARDIARRCRTGSIKRKLLRDFEQHRTGVTERIEIIGQESVGGAKRESIALDAERSLLQMEKIVAMPLIESEMAEDLKNNVQTLRSDLKRSLKGKALPQTPLARLPGEKRAMYEHLFELVYECSTNRSAAKALIDRIMSKIS